MSRNRPTRPRRRGAAPGSTSRPEGGAPAGGGLTLQLAYRILSARQVIAPPPESWDYPPPPEMVGRCERLLAERLARELGVIRDAAKLDLSNVCRWYAESPKLEWDIKNDVPNWAPPWPDFWAEWEEPTEWLMPDGRHRRAHGSQMGWLVVALDAGAYGADHGAWRRALGAFTGGGPLEELDDARLAAFLPQSRWVLCCDAFVSSGAPPVNGRPMWAGISAFLFVAPDGRLVETAAAGCRLLALERTGDLDQVYAGLHVLGLGLSFCHCKNVVRREAAADRGDRFHGRGRRGPRVPVLRFTTLDIAPMREVIRRDGRPAEQGLARALHDVRGHFARYTEERPLFGRPGLSGQFWIPDHTRGSEEGGAVVKEYRVLPGGGEPCA